MKKSFFALCAALLALGACNKNDVQPVPGSSVIRFSTNVRTYTVKSSDTSLDENDAVGIFATAPVGGLNTKYTVNAEGKLASESPLEWIAGETTPITFTAYYPYNEEVTSTTLSFAVAADQRGGIGASDLMAAVAEEVTPGTEVSLAFSHALSKVVVKVTNNLADDAVVSVEVKDVVLDAEVDLSAGTVTPGKEIGSILAAAVGDQYEAIIVPQTAKPTLVVTTASGLVYSFALKAETAFAGGKAATAELTLTAEEDPENTPVSIAFSVSAWEEAAVLETEDAVISGKVWKVAGIGGWDAPEIEMTQTASGDKAFKGVWEADINYNGEEFKLHYGDDWNIQAGMNPSWKYYGLGVFTADSYLWGGTESINIVLGTDYVDNAVVPVEAGSYHVKFVYDGYVMTVTKNEE